MVEHPISFKVPVIIEREDYVGFPPLWGNGWGRGLGTISGSLPSPQRELIPFVEDEAEALARTVTSSAKKRLPWIPSLETVGASGMGPSTPSPLQISDTWSQMDHIQVQLKCSDPSPPRNDHSPQRGQQWIEGGILRTMLSTQASLPQATPVPGTITTCTAVLANPSHWSQARTVLQWGQMPTPLAYQYSKTAESWGEG